MRIKLSPSQIQKQTLAPIMQQSIEILLLPITELNSAIEQELQENPLLEVDDEKTLSEKESLDALIEQRISQIKESPFENFYDGTIDDEIMEQKPITRSAPLEDYLLEQLRFECDDPIELEIGEFIIGNLNEEGYLLLSCEEINETLHINNITLVEKILSKVQNFDPPGIASRNLQECLLNQVLYRYNGNSILLSKLITEFLTEISKKKYADIARKTKLSIEKVKQLTEIIASLEPKPARNFRPITENIYIKPDIIITKNEDNKNFTVTINKKHVPQLRINKIYQRMLHNPNSTQEEQEFIREKIKNAILFIRSIEQRHQTIENIANYILEHQRDFFFQGSTAIKPMVLRDVAQSIDRNESTVSRAINNKYIDTPHGLLPIKFFFSQGLSKCANSDISSRSMKEELKDLIMNENKSKPLSDQEIQNYFESKDMKIARRTISKYRQNLNILPSHLRKE